MIPVLHQDGSRLDWKSAQYRVDVEANDAGAVVMHELSEAPELLALIEARNAAYAVEIRCPRTLFARTWVSCKPRLDVNWRDTEVDGQIYLFPGVLALKETALPTSGLIELWDEGRVEGRIHVPSGAWLARGDAFATRNLAASLIEFRKEDSLEEGRMRVDEVTGGSDARFLVMLSPKAYERVLQGDRDVQVAGLIAAFAKLPASPRFDEDADSPVARMLRGQLEDAAVPTWDTDEWDPAWAATTIEPFYPASFAEQRRDEA